MINVYVSQRKGDWSANKDRFELERMWWCCGEPVSDLGEPLG